MPIGVKIRPNYWLPHQELKLFKGSSNILSVPVFTLMCKLDNIHTVTLNEWTCQIVGMMV